LLIICFSLGLLLYFLLLNQSLYSNPSIKIPKNFQILEPKILKFLFLEPNLIEKNILFFLKILALILEIFWDLYEKTLRIGLKKLKVKETTNF